MYDDFLARHEKIALMYSGGKDSLACLHLFKNYLDRITVVWVNTGAYFPEIVDAMEDLKSRVPNFIEVTSNQPRSIEQNGYPTDVLPADYSKEGQLCTSQKPVKLRNYVDCCKENIWIPAAMAVKHYGFTGVIRGQRADEEHKAPITNGYVEDGIEYLLPIESWTQAQVVEFLQKSGVDTAGRLSLSHSSLDCWDCTAYCNQSKARMDYVRDRYPEQHTKVIHVLRQINDAVTEQMSGLRNLINEV